MADRARLIEWDKRYVWHPFTQMKDWAEAEPLMIERGEGFYLVDVDGRRYIDGVSSLWVLVHGHGKKELLEAMEEQAKLLCHSTLLGLANVPSTLLARKLVEIAPSGLAKVFYSDNGSTSVEIALKMAYQYWQQRGEKKRKRFISFMNGYHGDTIGSVSVGGIDLFHHVYRRLLFKTFKAPSPYCYRCPLKRARESCNEACVKVFADLVTKHREEACAVVLEPLVQGAAGMIVQPRGFLRRVWEIAKEAGLLFIADEVATGFGRTGTLFACDQEGVRPDFLCLSKSITGGYLPLAATLTSEEVYNAFLGEFHEFKTFFHGHTYTGNPVACAVALENLSLYEREGLMTRIGHTAEILGKELWRFKELPHVGDVRQKGLMVGIELVKNRRTKGSYGARERIGQRVTWEARRRGAVIRPLGDVIVLMPPLTISETLLRDLLRITYESIVAVTGS